MKGVVRGVCMFILEKPIRVTPFNQLKRYFFSGIQELQHGTVFTKYSNLRTELYKFVTKFGVKLM